MKQTMVRLRQSTEAAIQEFARSAYLDALESRHEPYIGASHNRTLTDSVSRTLAPPQSSLRSHAAVCAEHNVYNYSHSIVSLTTFSGYLTEQKADHIGPIQFKCRSIDDPTSRFDRYARDYSTRSQTASSGRSPHSISQYDLRVIISPKNHRWNRKSDFFRQPGCEFRAGPRPSRKGEMARLATFESGLQARTPSSPISIHTKVAILHTKPICQECAPHRGQ